VACADAVCDLLAEVIDVQPVYMANEDKAAALVKLVEAERRLAEARLRVMAASSDLADHDGARDVAAWLASRTQAESGPLRADLRLATEIETRYQRVAAGMASGTVSTDQARVIVHALGQLPDRLGPEVHASAETKLVELAAEFTPAQLRRLARHILELVAPEIAEAEAAKRLEEEERRARAKTALRTKRLGEGMSRTTIVHPDLDADRLRTYLESFTSPRKQPEAVTGEEDRLPYPQRMGHAFGALLEHLDPTRLPQHGGDATTLMVTVSLEALMADLGTGAIVDGDLDAGDNLSATAIRRLACEAGIVPVVLGGDGEILDVGRTRRLHTPAMRKAMRLRDRRCRAEGCTVPAAWCEAHHDIPWAKGGTTSLAHGRLYCSWHHHRAHDPRFQADKLPNGDVRFTRRR
jgi:hypothetical protein